MGLEDDFKKAAEDATKLPDKVSDADKLILYGLYKQATVGDVNTARPGMLDLKGKAKWDAWEKNKGMDKDKAMENYVMKVKQLQEDLS